MKLLQFKIPRHFTEENLQQNTGALNKNGHSGSRGKTNRFPGRWWLYDDIDHTPHYIIQTWPLPDDTGKWNSNGLVLGIYTM